MRRLPTIDDIFRAQRRGDLDAINRLAFQIRRLVKTGNYPLQGVSKAAVLRVCDEANRFVNAVKSEFDQDFAEYGPVGPKD